MAATTTRKTTKTTSTTRTTSADTDAVADCKQCYGKSGPSLMAALKADGFDGRTLAERAEQWHAAQQAAADAVDALDATDTDTDLEPVASAETVLAPAVVEPVADADADQQRAADQWAGAVDAALASVEPAAGEPAGPFADVQLADNPPRGDAFPDRAADELLPLPEPEVIPAADPAPTAPAVAPAPVVPIPQPLTPRPSGRSGGDVNLMEASRQWAERPADERYWTVADALDATRHHKETAREVAFDWADAELRPSDDGRDIVLALPAYGIDGATLTNYSARQLCASVGAPHSYLAKLPTDLAADCLRAGLVAKHGHRADAGGNALVHQNGTTKLRSINSDRYARFWNCEVFESLLPLVDAGWRTPPARPSSQDDPRSRRATAEDVMTRRTSGGGLSVNVGDWIAPAGIYASAHDMFAFLVNESVRLDDGTPDGLARGFFISNSEVGAAALKLKAFYYRHVCGNHIVWGAEEVVDVSIRHVGTADSIRQAFKMKVTGALERLTAADNTADHQRTIDRARSFMLTSNTTDPATARKEVLDALIRAVSGNRTLKPASGISVGMFDKAISAAVEFADVDKVHPYSLWGAINGLTRYSQSADVGASYADERAKVDALVPKLLSLVAEPAAVAA